MLPSPQYCSTLLLFRVGALAPCRSHPWKGDLGELCVVWVKHGNQQTLQRDGKLCLCTPSFMKSRYMNKTALGSQELYQVLEKLSFLHASGTDDRENSSLAAAGEAVCDPSKLPVVRKPNVWGLIWSPQRKLVGILAYKAVWHWVILPLKETVPRRSCWVLNLQPHLLFKNESIWPNSKREEQPTWCELPAASCGEMWACVGGCSLVSVSQPAVDYSGGATDRARALSAAELFYSGWQPATCCATILVLSWGFSDKLNSSGDGERSGSSAGRCPSDSH